MKKVILIFLLLTISSCVSKKKDEILHDKIVNSWSENFRQDYDDTKAVDVFVVTNRKQKSKNFACGENAFEVKVFKDSNYGLCKISVPRNHVVGELKPAQKDNQSSSDFFKVLDAKSMQKNELIEILQKSDYTPLVFVHGFNVPYNEAVLRASQIAYDLKYPGLTILFTWPAGASESGGFSGFFEDSLINRTYEENLLNAKDSIAAFKKFIEELGQNKIKVNLMVHSMGHQVVLPALKYLGETNENKIFINKLFLNAPDFAVDEFKKTLGAVRKITKNITLYCSNNDKAMSASKIMNKDNRLGACANFEGVDVINVSAIDDPTFGLGHGYYSSRPILGDMFQNMMGVDARLRLFIYKSQPNSPEKYFLRR